jgi:hypothetical protein
MAADPVPVLIDIRGIDHEVVVLGTLTVDEQVIYYASLIIGHT